MTDSSSPTGVGPAVDAIPHEGRSSSAAGRSVLVIAEDARERLDPPVELDRWSALAGSAAEYLGARGEMTLTFVDVDEIAELNATHMGVDGPTDVLSFPLDDEAAVGEAADDAERSADGPPRLIGDIVICPAVAAEAAATHAGTVDDELALLVVHGVLHLLGYDHANPDDTASMRAQEMKILMTYHWRGPAPSGFRHDHAEAVDAGIADAGRNEAGLGTVGRSDVIEGAS